MCKTMRTEIIISNQYDPYLNRAVETYLTDTQPDDTVSMYLWQNERTVVIGINQNPYSECNVERLIGDGGRLMRRKTGGGAVYHDLGNLNFSFVASKKNYDVRRQQSVIQEALRHFGLEAEISGRNDLTCQGRKFSGNAFYNGTRNNLHHGTILIKTDAEMMQRYLTVKKAKLMKNGVKSVASRVINLSEAADVTAENIKRPLIDAFAKTYQTTPATADFDTIAALPEVQGIYKEIRSHEYIFGKWENFKTSRQRQFDWGNVEIDLNINESKGVIDDIRIASDCLDPDVIGTAESLLKGQSTLQTPILDCNSPIINDIVELIYT